MIESCTALAHGSRLHQFSPADEPALGESLPYASNAYVLWMLLFSRFAPSVTLFDSNIQSS